MINPTTFSEALKRFALDRGFSAQIYGSVPPYELLALERPGSSSDAPRIYLSAGIHGDEPAGPLAVQALLERDLLPTDFAYTICPLLNPVGIHQGTRENGAGADLNRDFLNPSHQETRSLMELLESRDPFALSICLHEDWESEGFYLYSLGNDPGERVARRILDAAASIGPIELAEEIDGHPAAAGLISRSSELDIHSIEKWPEAFFLYSQFEHVHFTTESPSARPIEERIEMQIAAVQAAVSSAAEIVQSGQSA